MDGTVDRLCSWTCMRGDAPAHDRHDETSLIPLALVSDVAVTALLETKCAPSGQAPSGVAGWPYRKDSLFV